MAHWKNRARLLVEIVKGIRSAVDPGFAVAVKLNSADFQRGGFSSEDAEQVIGLLNDLGVDLIELSGGSYEAPAMQGQARDGRTLAREAYFLEFARDLLKVAQVPVMVTGGVRRLSVAEEVINSGMAMVGIATAMAIEPQLPAAWEHGYGSAPELRPISWSNKPLASLAYMAVVKYQLHKHSKNAAANPKVSPVLALVRSQIDDAVRTRNYKRRMAQLAAL